MMQVESTGEALITIGGPGGWGPELLTEAELAVILKRVEKVMGAAFADMTVLRERKVPSNSEAAGKSTHYWPNCLPGPCASRFTVQTELLLSPYPCLCVKTTSNKCANRSFG